SLVRETAWSRLGYVATFHMTAVSSDTACRNPGSIEGLGRIERTDGDVISVGSRSGKLHSSNVWIHMWLFFQRADERARPWQSHLFHWSDHVPGWLQGIGLFTVAAGYALALWAMRVNRFSPQSFESRPTAASTSSPQDPTPSSVIPDTPPGF